MFNSNKVLRGSSRESVVALKTKLKQNKGESLGSLHDSKEDSINEIFNNYML